MATVLDSRRNFRPKSNSICIYSLTTSDLKEIAELEENQAKELLAKKLGIPPCFDPEDQQKPLFISFLYDNLKFAAGKGFHWEHVRLVLKFAHEYLKRILVENHKLVDAIQDLKSLETILEPLSSRQKQQYADFILETILMHYNLYKYAFSNPRDVNTQKVSKVVFVPTKPLPLYKGKEAEIFEYDEQIKQLDNKEAETISTIKEKISYFKETLGEHNFSEDIKNVPTPYNKMTLEELVKNVLGEIVEKKEAELQLHVEQTFTDLNFKCDKTSVPRPSVLGSPPRFNPKLHLVTSKPNTSNNSLKSDKRTNTPAIKTRREGSSTSRK